MLTSDQRIVLFSQKCFEPDGPRPQVVVAYEDLNMALRATNVMALIAREAGDILDIQFSLWRFDAFDSPDLRELAARHAKQADIIVVAPAGTDGGLSAPVTSWLEEWSGCRQRRPGALVAVFDPAAGPLHATSVVSCDLRAVAGSTGMDFFCGAFPQFDAASAVRRRSPSAEYSARFPTSHHRTHLPSRSNIK